ncbi:DMT family transporter [Pontibacter burrus]|uniref:DMT family transporter n=1 Tax=Pontibacter burrus TaxID=2704466 RepID=A0A6B3LXW3_9BACT|nr:DMT family transporter [Pontibacter burrus]NEM98274.1 DMT family transporter [Pontibacter burrus]
MKELYFAIAIFAGLAITVQTGINSQLSIVTRNPVLTALISFVVGTAALLLYLLFSDRNALLQPVSVQAKWWLYTGGLLGALYVSTIVVIAPRLGAATTLGFVVASQLIFAVIFDQFGWLGFRCARCLH